MIDRYFAYFEDVVHHPEGNYIQWSEYKKLQDEKADLEKESERATKSYNAVIDYMLGDGRWEEPMEFLRCWNEGNFDALRKEWPDAPIEIYYADPLADHDEIDRESEK